MAGHQVHPPVLTQSSPGLVTAAEGVLDEGATRGFSFLVAMGHSQVPVAPRVSGMFERPILISVKLKVYTIYNAELGAGSGFRNWGPNRDPSTGKTDCFSVGWSTVPNSSRPVGGASCIFSVT